MLTCLMANTNAQCFISAENMFLVGKKIAEKYMYMRPEKKCHP